MTDRPAYDPNDERADRVEHRRKIAEACANPPFTPSESVNNPGPIFIRHGDTTDKIKGGGGQ